MPKMRFRASLLVNAVNLSRVWCRVMVQGDVNHATLSHVALVSSFLLSSCADFGGVTDEAVGEGGDVRRAFQFWSAGDSARVDEAQWTGGVRRKRGGAGAVRCAAQRAAQRSAGRRRPETSRSYHEMFHLSSRSEHLRVKARCTGSYVLVEGGRVVRVIANGLLSCE